MVQEAGKIRAVALINRVLDVRMEGGSYGYTSRAFREGGGALLTATSTVEEFEVEGMREVDLPHLGKQMCFVGTDYYGREMSLPLSRIRCVTPKDTEDQGRLKGLNWCLRNFDELRKGELTEKQKEALDAYFKELSDRRDALVAAGVTEYKPRRAREDGGTLISWSGLPASEDR